MANRVRNDIERSGFVAHEEKCVWVPVQEGELLGFVANLKDGTFAVPHRRIAITLQILEQVSAKNCVVSARTLAQVTGNLISRSLALGPVARLWTRSLYRDIQAARNWDCTLVLTSPA